MDGGPGVRVPSKTREGPEECDVGAFPIFLKEELGGPNAAERVRITARWERQQEKKRQAHERRWRRAWNAGKCGLCGEPVEEWNLRRPRNISTCGECSRPVQAQHYPSFGSTGWVSRQEGGPSKAVQHVLRACLVALWHLDHPEWRART